MLCNKCKTYYFHFWQYSELFGPTLKIVEFFLETFKIHFFVFIQPKFMFIILFIKLLILDYYYNKFKNSCLYSYLP